MRLMKTIVTRTIEKGEQDELVQVSPEAFICQCRDGEILFPFYFGKNWYGYSKEDWTEVVRVQGVRFVFNVRPYLGLLLSSMLPKVRSVWLALPDEERLRRVRNRGADRDIVTDRMRADQADESYLPLYKQVVEVHDIENAVQVLAEMLT